MAPLPCTPYGIVELLRRHDVPIAGAKVVVVGRGITVGRPLGLLLTRRSENATVTLCHTGTVDLATHVRKADIVVAAAGVPGIITADMVKSGAAVLDVGVSRVEGKIAGDVAEDVWDVAGWVSPNPGGVGPMTRAMLLANVVSMAEKQAARALEQQADEVRLDIRDAHTEAASFTLWHHSPDGPAMDLDDVLAEQPQDQRHEQEAA